MDPELVRAARSDLREHGRPVDGGSPVVLNTSADLQGASWAEDGTIVAALHPTRKLWRISASSGGNAEVILDLSNESALPAWPQVLPGGDLVLYTVHAGAGPAADSSAIEILSIRSGRRTVLHRGGTFGRYLPNGYLTCPDGRAPLFGRSTCYATGTEFPDLGWVRGEVQAGRIKAFGEVMPQVLGLAPGDLRMQPYWALAEEFDIPVGIHMGPGPPGAAYESSPPGGPGRITHHLVSKGSG